MGRAAAPRAPERLRALPHALGRPLHGRRRDRRQAPSRADRSDPRARVRRGEPDQRPDRRPDLAHDLPDDAQDRLHEHPRREEEAEGPPRDALRELARQAVLDGVPRLAVLQARLLGAHLAGPRRPVHRRHHHPGGGPLHGDGLRLVVPHRRRPGLHARPGLRERPDHARPVRADRDASRERREQPDRAVQGPALQRRRLHRHPARARERLRGRSSSGRRGSSGSRSVSSRSSTRSRSSRSSRRSSSSSPSRPTTS